MSNVLRVEVTLNGMPIIAAHSEFVAMELEMESEAPETVMREWLEQLVLDMLENSDLVDERMEKALRLLR